MRSNLSEVGSRLVWFIISEIWSVITFAVLLYTDTGSVWKESQSRLRPDVTCVLQVVVCWQLHNDVKDFYLDRDWHLNTCTIWADLAIWLSWVEIALNILTRERPTHMKYVDRSLSRYVLKRWQLFRDVSFSHQRYRLEIPAVCLVSSASEWSLLSASREMEEATVYITAYYSLIQHRVVIIN